MTDRVVDIETYKIFSQIQFYGNLRNEKRFELLQKVFIVSEGTLHECTIKGIELECCENPNYIYKIEIPRELVERDNNGETIRISRTCSNIFSTVQEAKESALKLIDHYYELNKNNINQFFDKYE